jgi:predicted ATP-dependent endonuclease of OLD family
MPLKSTGMLAKHDMLAALEAMTEYPDLVQERVVLLLEEPDTHLLPHLRRKIRKVPGEPAKKGWTVVYTTHSSELVCVVDIDEQRALRTAVPRLALNKAQPWQSAREEVWRDGRL